MYVNYGLVKIVGTTMELDSPQNSKKTVFKVSWKKNPLNSIMCDSLIKYLVLVSTEM